MFEELNQETGFKLSPCIPTFFENYKNSKCEILLNTLTNSYQSQQNKIFDIPESVDKLPEM